MRAIALWTIRGYQRIISPMLPPSCRFYPSCSDYTYQAIDRYGLWRGGLKGAWRILRCNPWNDGGYDPVDPADREQLERERAERDAHAATPPTPAG